MTKHKSIQPLIWIFTFFLWGLNTVSANQQYSLQSKDTSGVLVVEMEKNILFIYNSDSIVLVKSLKEYSCIFQLKELHQLFFNNHHGQTIKINELNYNQKESRKKKKYFNVKGFIPNLINPYEWIIRVENPNATRSMDLNKFLIDARAALVEIKIEI